MDDWSKENFGEIIFILTMCTAYILFIFTQYSYFFMNNVVTNHKATYHLYVAIQEWENNKDIMSYYYET
jgi:hypothetical protein